MNPGLCNLCCRQSLVYFLGYSVACVNEMSSTQALEFYDALVETKVFKPVEDSFSVRCSRAIGNVVPIDGDRWKAMKLFLVEAHGFDKWFVESSTVKQREMLCSWVWTKWTREKWDKEVECRSKANPLEILRSLLQLSFMSVFMRVVL